jgi:hypothetical protein
MVVRLCPKQVRYARTGISTARSVNGRIWELGVASGVLGFRAQGGNPLPSPEPWRLFSSLRYCITLNKNLPKPRNGHGVNYSIHCTS